MAFYSTAIGLKSVTEFGFQGCSPPPTPLVSVIVCRDGCGYFRILPHISAYVCIYLHTSTYVCIHPHMSVNFRISPHISAYLTNLSASFFDRSQPYNPPFAVCPLQHHWDSRTPLSPTSVLRPGLQAPAPPLPRVTPRCRPPWPMKRSSSRHEGAWMAPTPSSPTYPSEWPLETVSSLGR